MMSGNLGEMTITPREPVSLFVARLGAEQRGKAMADAFAKA